MDEERIKKLRQDPDFKALVRALKGQSEERIERFIESCNEDETTEGTTDEQAPNKIPD